MKVKNSSTGLDDRNCLINLSANQLIRNCHINWLADRGLVCSGLSQLKQRNISLFWLLSGCCLPSFFPWVSAALCELLTTNRKRDLFFSSHNFTSPFSFHLAYFRNLRASVRPTLIRSCNSNIWPSQILSLLSRLVLSGQWRSNWSHTRILTLSSPSGTVKLGFFQEGANPRCKMAST